MNEVGVLYIVATPIGNLKDITFRAIETLKNVDVIAAEDTRHTLKLLNHFEIKKPLTSYYEHNKIQKGNSIIAELLEGKNFALVSDAGTPGISDPGEELIKLCIQNNINVIMIPGACAMITGLVISGLPTARFVFEGFLPMNKSLRKEKITKFKNEERTIILYEAPHKLKNTLDDLYEILGNRHISLARELTKLYEEVIRTDLVGAIQLFKEKQPKGEFVVVIEGIDEKNLEEKQKEEFDNISIQNHVNQYIEQGFDKKSAIKKVADLRKMSKRDVYKEVMND